MVLKNEVIMILGASGFVGSALATHFKCLCPTVLVNRHNRELDGLSLDLTIDESWKQLHSSLKLKPTIIINAAGLVGIQDGKSDMDYFAANTYLAMKAAEYASLSHSFLIHLSSSGVYGFREDISAETTPNPGDIYNLTKYLGEIAVLSRSGATKALILRLNFPYGPMQKKGLIPTLAHKVIAEEEVILNTSDGRPVVSPLFIIDFLTAIELACRQRLCGVYNLAGKEHRSIKNIADIIADITGKKVRFKLGTSPCLNLAADATKLAVALQWEPLTKIEQGLEQVITDILNKQKKSL